MQYIKLNNNSYILHTSNGAEHLTKNSFNFYKIQTMIDNGAEEEDIKDLLKAPKLPNGIYMVYRVPRLNKMYYKHTVYNDGEMDEYFKWIGKEVEHWEAIGSEGEFVGNYASYEDIKYDWPEYLL